MPAFLGPSIGSESPVLGPNPYFWPRARVCTGNLTNNVMIYESGWLLCGREGVLNYYFSSSHAGSTQFRRKHGPFFL